MWPLINIPKLELSFVTVSPHPHTHPCFFPRALPVSKSSRKDIAQAAPIAYSCSDELPLRRARIPRSEGRICIRVLVYWRINVLYMPTCNSTLCRTPTRKSSARPCSSQNRPRQPKRCARADTSPPATSSLLKALCPMRQLLWVPLHAP
jgi:hypothetical protein